MLLRDWLMFAVATVLALAVVGGLILLINSIVRGWVVLG
jgi:hypothetical protein